jgi:hypothetical protein
MAYCLDESWALTYFQVTVTILIFGVGIPSLILQTIVPDEVRRVVYNQRGFLRFRWGTTFVIILMFLALTFVWGLHPCSNSYLGYLKIFEIKIDQQIIGAVIITFAIVCVGISWFFQSTYRRDRVLNMLRRGCYKRIHQGKEINEKCLQDIIYLGENGKSREEKLQVLETLESIANRIISDNKYDGNKLEALIKAIDLTLQRETNPENLAEELNCVRRIAEKLSEVNFESPVDPRFILRVLKRVGRMACSSGNERSARTVLSIFEIICDSPNGSYYYEAALALQELSTIALKSGRYPIAFEYLNKVEAIILPLQPLDENNSSPYLGLLAQFWIKKGSAKDFARSRLNQLSFKSSTKLCLQRTQERFFNIGRFDTADALNTMIGELGPS